jgi:hypothetical protein
MVWVGEGDGELGNSVSIALPNLALPGPGGESREGALRSLPLVPANKPEITISFTHGFMAPENIDQSDLWKCRGKLSSAE